MFSKGLPSDFKSPQRSFSCFDIPQTDLASRYLGITSFPTRTMCSPLREDKHPSFRIYLTDKNGVRYKDFATGENGDIYTLLSRLWQISRPGVFLRIEEDFFHPSVSPPSQQPVFDYKSSPRPFRRSTSVLQVKERPFRDYDLAYWASYGISLRWLRFADIHAVSHVFYTRDNRQSVFPADKYAYAFVEHKEGHTTIKIYQPFNTSGRKWQSKHDGSVLSLWRQLPAHGPTLLICSSLKDALCLWANVSIPSIALQGEGYSLSPTALSQLRERFTHVFIALDGDGPGIRDARHLHDQTGLPILSCPVIDKAKDWSDIYHYFGPARLRSEFHKSMTSASSLPAQPTLFS